MHPVPALLTETLRARPPLGTLPAGQWHARVPRGDGGRLTRRYGLPAGALDPEGHVLPCAGTKEALFMIAQAVVPERKAGRTPSVLLPNPFYNVYLGAAAIAGADPVLLSVSAATGHLPALEDLAPELLERTAAFYLCSPANPQGGAPISATCGARSNWRVATTSRCWSTNAMPRFTRRAPRRRARGGVRAGWPVR